MNPSITVISKRVFVFNTTLTPEQQENIGKALDVLERLYLTPFDLVLISSEIRKTLKYGAKLYEDPEIYLLSPGEVLATVERPIGYTQGVLARTNLEFGSGVGFFLAEPLSEIMDKFTGYNSLFFAALQDV